jgi:hypothetical protein
MAEQWKKEAMKRFSYGSSIVAAGVPPGGNGLKPQRSLTYPQGFRAARCRPPRQAGRLPLQCINNAVT